MTQTIDKLKQTKHNTFYLFQQGYSLVALPLSLFNFASIVYYLVIASMPPLKAIFPEFIYFLAVGVIVGPITCVLIGIVYIKSPIFRANYEVTTSANPYSFIIMPKDIPLYTAVMKICEDRGLTEEAEKLRAIINNSI